MRAVVQRVSRASVAIDRRSISEIGIGFSKAQYQFEFSKYKQSVTTRN